MLSILDRAMVASRFVLVVFFFGLLVGLVLFAIRFVAKLGKMASDVLTMGDEEMLLGLLHLVDSALVASLVVMVAMASYDNLVSRLAEEAAEAQMGWGVKTDHSNLKIKVATAIIAISSIHLLQVFLRVDEYSNEGVMWRVVIHAIFLLGAVLLGVLDRISRGPDGKGH
jgi:uncharacterized protein (TIGR00645 family)